MVVCEPSMRHSRPTAVLVSTPRSSWLTTTPPTVPRSWRLERAPLFAKLGRDVFGELGGELPLVRALKARFDPAGVLNPGRFAGGV